MSWHRAPHSPLPPTPSYLSGGSSRSGVRCWPGRGGIPVTRLDSSVLDADGALELDAGLAAGSALLTLLPTAEEAVEGGVGRLAPADGGLLPAALLGRRALERRWRHNDNDPSHYLSNAFIRC